MKRTIKKIAKLVRYCLQYCYSLPLMKKDDVLLYDDAERILAKHSPDPNTSPICKNIIHEPMVDMSIIVPVYNVEKYLEECLKSVLHQKTKYKYNVIAINDGSTDRSGEILNSFSNDEKLVIINQENKGLSEARNAGLRDIYSKYIMFVDSDDILLDGAIEKLLDTAYRVDADVVQGGCWNFNDDSGRTIDVIKYKNIDKLHSSDVLSGIACCKIYKAQLFEKVCFPAHYWYEDTIISSIVLYFADHIATISDIIYKYRRHKNSITGNGERNPKSIDTIWVTECAIKARKEMKLITDLSFYEFLFLQIAINYKRTRKEPDNVKRSIFALTKRLLERQRADNNFVVNKRYQKLERAILDGNYTKYSIICNNWQF